MFSRNLFVYACFAILIISMTFIGCSGNKGPEIAQGIDECDYCKMVIDKVNEGCGYYHENEFITFDSPDCLLKGVHGLREAGNNTPSGIYFADYKKGGMQVADSTYFLLTDHIRTVMNGRVLCFKNSKHAKNMIEHDDETVVDWIGYLTIRGIPDKQFEVTLTENTLSPDVFELQKNDLGLLKIKADGISKGMSLSIKGYPEIEEFTIPSDGTVFYLRLLASRPGAGFPIVNSATNNPIGMIKVSGAHTTDEEAM